jgi:hypothetical protein
VAAPRRFPGLKFFNLATDYSPMTVSQVFTAILFASCGFAQQGTIQDRPIPKPHLIRGDVTKMDRADEPKPARQSKSDAKSQAGAAPAAATTGEVDPVKRHAAAEQSFREDHVCPMNNRNDGPCPGFVIGYAKALACGGVDEAANMRWQTLEASKEIAKPEGEGCKPAK